jgi:Ca2+-binding EF-hand superfamily protein
MNHNYHDSIDQNREISSSNNNTYMAEINEPVPNCMYPHTRNNRDSYRPGVHFGTDSIEENTDSIEHIKSLTTQTLTALCEMVQARHRSGKSSLLEIYRHFDRDGKGYFNAQDLQEASSDLRIETSNRVAHMAINQIAIDGHDNVSYGEFLVFIHDSHHKSLEQFVQNQMAQQYERQGKYFRNDFHAYFVNEERKNRDAFRGMRDNGNFQQEIGNESGIINKQEGKGLKYIEDGFVEIKPFVSILHQLGLKLETVDMNRLVTRFDVTGNGKTCSFRRFIRMVEGCAVWKKAEEVPDAVRYMSILCYTHSEPTYTNKDHNFTSYATLSSYPSTGVEYPGRSRRRSGGCEVSTRIICMIFSYVTHVHVYVYR